MFKESLNACKALFYDIQISYVDKLEVEHESEK